MGVGEWRLVCVYGVAAMQYYNLNLTLELPALG